MFIRETKVDLLKTLNTKIFYECTKVQADFYKTQINTCQFEKD